MLTELMNTPLLLVRFSYFRMTKGSQIFYKRISSYVLDNAIESGSLFSNQVP